MDPLVKAALDRVNEAVSGLPWNELEDIKEKRTERVPAGRNLLVSVGPAIHAVDALRSALLSLPYTCP
ncbi:MAG: hypothetical protein HYX95_01370 [Chloroflexi bacterium]|nr:hypothetical protein [Chloroflexota bacterium]